VFMKQRGATGQLCGRIVFEQSADDSTGCEHGG
jgi:hypothetical protein